MADTVGFDVTSLYSCHGESGVFPGASFETNNMKPMSFPPDWESLPCVRFENGRVVLEENRFWSVSTIQFIFNSSETLFMIL